MLESTSIVPESIYYNDENELIFVISIKVGTLSNRIIIRNKKVEKIYGV